MNNHEKILSSTLALISQKGFKGTTTKEIATLSGLNESTIFKHFKSKNKILEECFEKETLEFQQEVTRIREAHYDNLHDLIYDLSQSLVRFYKNHRSFILVVIKERDNEQLDYLKNYDLTQFTSLIAEKLNEIIPNDLDEVNTQTLSFMINSSLIMWLINDAFTKEEKLLTQINQLNAIVEHVLRKEDNLDDS